MTMEAFVCSLGLYAQHAAKRSREAKMSYFCGLLSCLIVVFATMVIGSLLANVPVMFLKLAESNTAQVDLILSAGAWTKQSYLNYSAMARNIGSAGRSAPRSVVKMQVQLAEKCPITLVGSDKPGTVPVATAWRFGGSESTPTSCASAGSPGTCLGKVCQGGLIDVHVYLMDLRKESAAAIGAPWLAPLQRGQVYVNEYLRQLLVTRTGTLAKGTPLYTAVALSATGLEVNLRTGSEGLPAVPAHGAVSLASWRVAGSFNDTAGRIPEDHLATIPAMIVDYGSFLRHLVEDGVDPAHLLSPDCTPTPEQGIQPAAFASGFPDGKATDTAQDCVVRCSGEGRCTAWELAVAGGEGCRLSVATTTIFEARPGVASALRCPDASQLRGPPVYQGCFGSGSGLNATKTASGRRDGGTSGSHRRGGWAPVGCGAWCGGFRYFSIASEDGSCQCGETYQTDNAVDRAICEPAGFTFAQETAASQINPHPSTASAVYEVGPSLSPEEYISKLAGMDAYGLAETVLVNLPGSRSEAYINSNFDQVQANLVRFSTDVQYRAGFPDLQAQMPILQALSKTQMMGLFLGLAMNIVVAVLMVLSVALIYSLLLVDVETRTHEMGIVRMLGATRGGVVAVVVFQALLYAVPACLAGTLVSHLTLVWLLEQLQEQTRIEIDRGLDPTAVAQAWLLGLVMPTVACILPAQRALGTTIRDALDTARSKVKAVVVSIHRSDGEALPVLWMASGGMLAAFGLSIYYLFPLALLSGSVGLLMNIFLVLLLSMLLGLVLLSLNLSQIVERLLLSLTIDWWEARAVSRLVRKNLSVHRTRNMQSSVMFALSTAFIVFLATTADLQVASMEYLEQRREGTKLPLKAPTGYTLTPFIEVLEKELATPEMKQYIAGYTWVTHALRSVTGGGQSWELSNVGGNFGGHCNVYGISPNYLDTVIPGLAEVSEGYTTSQGLDVVRQLYTAEGSASIILSTSAKAKLSVGIGDLVKLSQPKPNKGEGHKAVHLLRPLAFAEAFPGFRFPGSVNPGGKQVALVSMPTYMRLLRSGDGQDHQRLDRLPMHRLLLKLKDGVSDAQHDTVVAKLRRVVWAEGSAGGAISFRPWKDQKGRFEMARLIMGYFFGTTTTLAMFICFFSLMAAMHANIHDQKKEIAVLRAVGASTCFVYRVYIYEAAVLVMASGLLGMAIGTVVGYTMALQRSTFLSLPVDFNFPYSTARLVGVFALLFGVLSTWFPLRRVLAQRVYSAMRQAE